VAGPDLLAARKAAEIGDAFGALIPISKLLESPQSLGPDWAEVTMMAARLQLHDAAAAAARRLYAETPPSHMTAVIVAHAMEAAGFADEGATTLLPWAQAGRLAAHERFLLARLLSFANRLDEAETQLRALMAGNADDAFCWSLLAQGKKFSANDRDITAMQALRAKIDRALPHQLAAISYALAKAYVDTGDDSGAAKALGDAAAAKQVLAKFDGDSIEQAERSALELAEDSDKLGRPADLPESASALFIMGSPRSGTTLVEHILASHSQVAGGGEHNFMWLASKLVGDISGASVLSLLARARAGGETDPWGSMGKRYLGLLKARLPNAAGFVTDKQLSNHWRIGLIRRALPKARIVWVRRNPLDIAWSCWRTNFNLESGWACSPALLARYIASYRRVMEAWIERHPDAIITVQYEDLVRNPDEQIPRLLGALGLPDEAQVRQPHQQDRSVTTASFAQVRAPISAGRVGADKKFPLSTRPLREALSAVGLPC
jgi:hypothetical protein